MARTTGPWRFEPHGGYRQVIAEMTFPFGYISTPECSPLFELDHFFDVSPKKLAAAALLMAAAPELLTALTDLLAATERHVFGDECLAEREAARAVLSKTNP